MSITCDHIKFMLRPRFIIIFNIPIEIDVHFGLQTLERTSVSASFTIRLQCGGIHFHIIYLMWLIFAMVYSSTYMTRPGSICSCK